MQLCAKLVCASLLPLAGPAAAKARAPQEDPAPTLEPFANVFLDSAWFDGYGARYGDGEATVRLAEAGIEFAHEGFHLRVAYDFAGDGEWRDAGVFWKRQGAYVALGQFKEPASLEKFTFQEDAQLAEPAGFTSAFALSRRFGVLAGAYDKAWTLAAGAFSGSLDGVDAQGRGPGQMALTARATRTGLRDERRWHAGAYARVLDYDGAGYVAASYPGSKLAAKTLYADFTSEVEDGLAERSMLAGFELAWSRPGFHVQAEAARQAMAFEARPDADLWGVTVTASWALTGETRPYIKEKGVFGALVPARPVHEGGPGALIATARVDLTDLREVGVGRATRYTAGFAWVARERVRLEAEYTAERGSGAARGRDSDTMAVRLRLGF
ncbi:MAG: porin [Oceanicaulis sp.]